MAIKNKEIIRSGYNDLLGRIVRILVEARTKVVREINKAQVLAYWEIGEEIVEFEQKGKAKAEYGEELIVKLAKDMTEKFGRGFSERNLRNMRAFYLNFPIRQTLSAKSLEEQKLQRPSGKSVTLSRKSEISQTLSDKFEPMLSWSHYCELCYQ
ncbi:MAG: hypothetical protein COT45_05675 [bacterium (Candidatus Stahlbacteria) CG08_land_8_20_14_0_20_40_26]|nr:MAG: hypothetical protein COX49_05845 [bacterium (Candidatus Stahlbacteria) CG23_combo_of_CG06-09_8_20_14_all_40_9]PIS23613.1 MAG: hypothetical protein COT45_05675 [bacterium (Candidatus Stahlbacteria) CG08_land_8_20_14_0_20_40_26]